MALREWKRGDRLVHGGRPEWGLGEVRTAESVVQNGARCQRLTIRFDRAGVKTISTAYADLRPGEEMPRVAQPTDNGDPENDPLSASAVNWDEKLQAIPEDATDPFKTRRARLEATLNLYRFTSGGGSLLDWAAAQTGLKDPLSKFSRHELERQFDRFRANLDAHLKKLAFEMRKAEPAALAQTLAAAKPEVRQALRRVDIGR
ncbi:MAG: DUF3553 domain-containing protein [Phycisphaerales bacterium]